MAATKQGMWGAQNLGTIVSMVQYGANGAYVNLVTY